MENGYGCTAGELELVKWLFVAMNCMMLMVGYASYARPIAAVFAVANIQPR